MNILKPKDIDESLYKNSREFEYELPVSKKVVVFKLQTIVEQKSIEKAIRSQEKAGIPLRNQTTTLKECIVSIDGNDDPKFINSFVDNYLLAKDSLHLRKFMLDINPDFDLTVVIDIPTEDFYQEMALPIDTSFFWPRL